MKFFIIGDIYTDTNKLALKLSNYYGIKVFSNSDIKNIDDINSIVRINKDWIIEGSFNKNIDVICNLADTIIFLDYKKNIFSKNIISDFKSDVVLNYLKKHIRKGLIIRNKRELKKYLKSVYEN